MTTFLIAGERRCGTTTLHALLRRHPDIYLPEKADSSCFIEPELFARSEDSQAEVSPPDWDSARERETLDALLREGEGRTAIGMKSADLLFWKPAHERIASLIPEVKIVVTLRDPVARAWSQYWNEVGKGREQRSFRAGRLRARR